MISIFGCICCGSILSLWPWGLILFSFVLNALSYIRDCTLFMAKGGGGGGGRETSKSVEMWGSFFKCSRIFGRYPISKIKQF